MSLFAVHFERISSDRHGNAVSRRAGWVIDAENANHAIDDVAAQHPEWHEPEEGVRCQSIVFPVEPIEPAFKPTPTGYERISAPASPSKEGADGDA